jgi:hypothetical protein
LPILFSKAQTKAQTVVAMAIGKRRRFHDWDDDQWVTAVYGSQVIVVYGMGTPVIWVASW